MHDHLFQYFIYYIHSLSFVVLRLVWCQCVCPCSGLVVVAAKVMALVSLFAGHVRKKRLGHVLMQRHGHVLEQRHGHVLKQRHRHVLMQRLKLKCSQMFSDIFIRKCSR